MTMSPSHFFGTHCLDHQLPADQPSPLGLICRECHSRLLANPPSGPCRGFWESQPILSDGEPCSVFTLAWADFQIRSLHPTTAWDDAERLAKEVLSTEYSPSSHR